MSLTRTTKRTAGALRSLPYTAKLAVAVALEVVGFFIQPIPILGALYTLAVLLPVSYFLFGLGGLLEGWEVIVPALAAWVPTMPLIGLISRSKKKNRRGKL